MSIIKLLPLKFKIFFENSLILITCFRFIFFSLKSFLHFLISLIKKIFLFLLIINLALGVGLLGLSFPLIFKIQATFSGALTNIKSEFFFLRYFEILLILELVLSPTIFSFKE